MQILQSESAAIHSPSIFKAIVYTSAFVNRQTIQWQKRVGNIKGARQPMKVQEEKEKNEFERDFQDGNASSRAFRYQRFRVEVQEHSSTVHEK